MGRWRSVYAGPSALGRSLRLELARETSRMLHPAACLTNRPALVPCTCRALIARHLIDTSAAARMTHPEVASRLAPLIEAGLVATTAQLDAEALCSARNSADYEQLCSDRRLAYEYLPTNDEHWQTALAAQ